MGSPVKIGIIGGTGLENANILTESRSRECETPFGKPSDALIEGNLDGVPCVLLARHGRRHDKSPSDVNYRANIWALYQSGVTHILVSTAVGSLREEIAPGDLLFLDSFIDRTHGRSQTFYDSLPGHPPGVCHIPMHPAFDPLLRSLLIETAKELNLSHHESGTAVCIEGPRYSSRAESDLFRAWGAHLVVLARELGIPYASTALVTDYDCWRETGEHVSVDLVMRTFAENADKACRLFRATVKKIASRDWTTHLASIKEMARAAVMLPPDTTSPFVV